MPAPVSAQRIRETIEPVVAAAGLWLEDVELARDAGRPVVRVVVDAVEDAEEAVDLDGVAAVSRTVSEALDALDGLPDRYTLEVSTRGADAPLTARRHYVRAIGRLVVLGLADGTVLAGRLVDVVDAGGAEGDAVVVTPVTPGVKGRPAKVGDPVRVPLERVREGRVEVELVKDGGRGEDGAGDGAADGPTGRED
ncbi:MULTISPECIES: ribosome maturation factor RimP [unclassified Cellulomonas]|uniref:ribosome maturation factor RimP n=1 Tax=unclassified Cellulomonas TaxID=2620175 RepID=UPI001984A408|nr:ribosome maturation factor RimP [Cellulomonas sp. ES6]MBD3781240.1 ribosome maturation factor RimP [Micrococcales bacterium]WHP17476.1 ribosome maturation factor RimP [Cellulomonas sp. ES6]